MTRFTNPRANQDRQRKLWKATVQGWPSSPSSLCAEHGPHPLYNAPLRAVAGAFRECLLNRWDVRYFVAQPEKSNAHDGSELKNKNKEKVKSGWLASGPNNGWHLQVYFETKTAVRVRTIRAHLAKHEWGVVLDSVETVLGENPDACRAYCTPEKWEFGDDKASTIIGDAVQWGHFIAHGSSETSDELDRCIGMILDGAKLKEVARAYPRAFVRHHSGLRSLMETIAGVWVE